MKKNQKIPKRINYCWFGGNEKSDLIKRCIESWEKYCPDYEIKEWNESNFDLNSNVYVKEAYDAKKWAFVSDYVRLWVLYNYGGIYLDTDVEIIKPLDDFLECNAFFASEDNKLINTGIGCASVKGGCLVKQMLDDYNNINFRISDKIYDETTCVLRGSNSVKKDFLEKIKNKSVVFNVDGNIYYPKEYFCPLNYETGELNINKNTVSIHWFNGSWMDDDSKKIITVEQKIKNKYKGINGKILSKIYRYQYRLKQFVKQGILISKIKDKFKRR